MANKPIGFFAGFFLLVGAVSLSAATPAWGAVTRNKLASNKLASNKLASNRLSSNRLSSNALSSNALEADPSSAPLLATADGRDVYSYIVGCALAGGLGLAADWADHKLASKDERWVSACVFARVNLHDTSEAISLRGDHPGLAVGQDEAELYTLEEGAFYGNLFTHEDDPIDWNACRGVSEAAGGEPGGLALRDCTEPDPADATKTLCGFNFAGDCSDYTPMFPSPYACRTFDPSQGVYGACHTSPGDGHWPKLKTYREVITVFVSN